MRERTQMSTRSDLLNELYDDERVRITGELMLAHLGGEAKMLIVIGVGEDKSSVGFISVHDSAMHNAADYHEPVRMRVEEAFTDMMKQIEAKASA